LTREIFEMVRRADVAADLTSVTSFYVALKSKPLVVLVGPRDTGKLSLVRVVARALTGADGLRYQEMVGHAWWAANCRGMAVLTQAQARFNAEKVLALVEETLLSQDAGSMSMACLAHISPAELATFFAEPAPQIGRGRLTRLGGYDLPHPTMCPPNLLLVGTMDDAPHDPWDLDMQRYVSVVQWAPEDHSPAPGGMPEHPPGLGGFPLRRLSVRSERAAFYKLQRLHRWQSRDLRPLFEVADLLQGAGVLSSARVVGEATIYLANAWSFDGMGLFARQPQDNLLLALDAVMGSSILPSVVSSLEDRPELRRRLGRAAAHLPRTLRLLRA
jgi:hypothetical protein